MKRSFNLIFTIQFIVTFFNPIDSAQAAARYWVASSTSNWNNTSNWSTSSGGTGGASVPSSSDDVYFNSSRNGNCTIDATVNINGIDIGGYSGTITNTTYSFTVSANNYFTQSSGTFNGGSSNITINSRLSISGGTFNCGSGTVDINGTGFYLSNGTFTSTSGILYITNYWNHSGGTFSHNNGTVVFDGTNSPQNTIVGGVETFYNLKVDRTSGAIVYLTSLNDKFVITNELTLNQGNVGSWSSQAVSLEAQGPVTVASGFGTINSAVTLNFTGTANQNFDLTGATNKVDGYIGINKSSGQVNLISGITMDGGGALTLTSGTLNLNGQTISISAGYNTTCTGTFILSGTGTLANYGYSQTSGSPALSISGASTFSISSGHFSMSTGTFNAGSATLDFNGNFSLTGGTFTGTSGNWYISRDWIHTTSGTFNHNSGTIIFDGNFPSTPGKIQVISNTETFNNLTFSLAAGSQCLYSANDNLILVGNLTLTSGSISPWNGGNAVSFEVQGNVLVSSSFGAMSADVTLKFSGSTQSLTMTGAESKILGNFSVSSSNNLNLASNVTVASGKSFSLTSTGTLNMNTYIINGSGSFSTSSGSRLRLGSTAGITSSGATGNIQVTGSRTYSTGTDYYYNGSAGAQVTGNGLPSTIASFTASNSSGVTLQSSCSVTSFVNVSQGTLDMGIYTLNRATLGGSFNVGTNAVLKINGSNSLPTNYSTYSFDDNSTIEFVGSSAQVIATGTYENIIINNSNGLTLSGDITVNGTLTLTSGRISLGTYNLSMGSGAILSGGNSSSFIYTGSTGAFKWLSCAASTSKTFPVGHTNSSSGYSPVVITFNSGHTTDDFSVIAYNLVTNDGTRTGTAYTSSVVKTTWNISETNSGGSNVNIQLQWNSTDEGTSFVRSNCGLSHYNGSAWESVGAFGSASGSDPYTFTYSGYTGSFSPFGINGNNGPLPVKLLFLNAQMHDNVVLLDWATSVEINNDYFVIEKSNDLKSFYPIGKVFGNGNSLVTNYYSFLDSSSLFETIYYRLKQVDFDGNFEYSKIVKLITNRNNLEPLITKLWPMPANNSLSIELKQSLQIIKINIYGQNGILIKSIDFDKEEKRKMQTVDISELKNGFYYVSITDELGKTDHKLFTISKK